MKKNDIRQTSAYRQMASVVFGEYQGPMMRGPTPTPAESRALLREMHEETLARIGQPIPRRAKAPAKASVQQPLMGTKPRAKRTTGSKGK